MPLAEHVAGAPVASSVGAATSHIHPTLLTADCLVAAGAASKSMLTATSPMTDPWDQSTPVYCLNPNCRSR